MKDILFETPLFQFTLEEPELNQALSSLLLEDEQKNSDNELSQRSNAGGYHTDWLQDRQEDCLQELRKKTWSCYLDVLNQSLDSKWKAEWTTSSWAVINRKGNYNLNHCHPHSDWSSVYYIDAGDSPPTSTHKDIYNSGRLQFIDPRGSLTEMGQACPNNASFYLDMFGSSSRSLVPTTGMLIFFPSYLLHSVLPYVGEKPRISLATNYSLRSASKLE